VLNVEEIVLTLSVMFANISIYLEDLQG